MKYFVRLIIFIVIIVYAENVAFAQTISWTKIYGGGLNDCGRSARQTTDGGYIIAGTANYYGSGYIQGWLIKTDTSGDTLWTRIYGGTGDNALYSVRQTTDGGYIISGVTTCKGAGAGDVLLIKTNANGDTLWTKTFGGSGDDYGFSVRQTTDSGYIIVGQTSSYDAGYYEVYLIKTNANGDTLWTRTFGGSGDDYGFSVQQTTDGGYIITATTHSYGAGESDIWLIKTNANGDTLWTRTFGGSNTDRLSLGNSVQQTTDGGYIITGMTRSYGAGDYDVWLIKTNSNGVQLWTRTFGGSAADKGFSVQQTTDGGYIISGYTQSYSAATTDAWLIKTNSNGDTLWTRIFGRNDGIKKTSNCRKGTSAEGREVQQTTDGGYIITGYVCTTEMEDVYLIKTDSFGNIGIEEGANIKTPSITLRASPNPFIQSTVITYSTSGGLEKSKIQIYDVAGKLVETTKNNVVGKNLKTGIYFIKVGDYTPLKIVKMSCLQ